MARGTSQQVKDLSPDVITRNDENPRMIFRAEELESLLSSISLYGIQVPITVYQEGRKFILIDGERRWRCARKLNLKSIPALVQPKPSDLTNLLLMFNIHALREQWDYLTIANKLPRVIELHKKERGSEPNEVELSRITGLTRGQIRRCRLLLDLPQKYRDQLLKELELPKSKQRLSEDFFIEMERAIKTVQNRLPGSIKSVNAVRDVLIEKYRGGVIDNIVDFRKLAKIATSVRRMNVPEGDARHAVEQIISESKAGVAEIYEARFAFLYDEERLGKQVEGILIYLDSINQAGLVEIDDDSLREALLKLKEALDQIFGDE